MTIVFIGLDSEPQEGMWPWNQPVPSFYAREEVEQWAKGKINKRDLEIIEVLLPT